MSGLLAAAETRPIELAIALRHADIPASAHRKDATRTFADHVAEALQYRLVE